MFVLFDFKYLFISLSLLERKRFNIEFIRLLHEYFFDNTAYLGIRIHLFKLFVGIRVIMPFYIQIKQLLIKIFNQKE